MKALVKPEVQEAVVVAPWGGRVATVQNVVAYSRALVEKHFPPQAGG